MKNWNDQMKKGMEMIAKACKENDNWTKCADCPFDSYCTALMTAELIDPFEGPAWNFAPPNE